MRNKAAVFFILIFFLAMCLWAHDPIFDHPLSEQNTAKFDAICAQLASRPYTKGIFEQERIIKSQNRSLISGGDFIIAADLGLVWITKYPAESITTLGKDYMIQSIGGGNGKKIDAKGNEVYINMADTISSLFVGNAQKLKAGFAVYYMDGGQASTGAAWVIGLVPKDKTFRNYIPQIVLAGIDDGNVITIRLITMYERLGSSTTYHFLHHTFPDALEAHEEAYFAP